MAALALALFLLLALFPVCSPQSTLQSERDMHPAPVAPPPSTHIQDLLRKGEEPHLNTKRTYGQVDQDNAKVGVFIAAAVGTVTLMAAVYCIYNKFYTKQQYLHTQLQDDTDLTADSLDPPPVFFHSAANFGDMGKAGYGSISAAPSVISVPPGLSPPPRAMPFPPRFLSSQSLRTISAKDLERSCI